MRHSSISIRGARTHNLKNIDLDLPRDKLVVITGISGSGKSSLAFDTIYAEGQRRYVESLSAYARQFLDQMDKPDVDSIEGLSPAISIEQKTTSKNPRSTVATVTEIYDYLRLLYARIGRPHCPQCGRAISAMTVTQMVDALVHMGEGAKLSVLAPVVRGRKGEYRKELDQLRKDGFVRARIDGEVVDLAEAPTLDRKKKHDIDVFIDRIAVKPGIEKRLADSLELALKLADGTVRILPVDGPERFFSQKFGCPVCEISFPEVEPRLFSFNNPAGACPTCHGLGVEEYFDAAKVIADPSLSINEGVVEPWTGPAAAYYRHLLDGVLKALGIDADTPWNEIPQRAQDVLLHGSAGREISFEFSGEGRTVRLSRPFEGILASLERRYRETESESVREELGRFLGSRPCPACRGDRLRKEALCVTVSERNIIDTTRLTIGESLGVFRDMQLDAREAHVGERILKEIRERLGFLDSVGLSYLSLDRTAGTLSGGEAQRIRLASQIGSALVGVLYVLDEPSIGLHQRDNDKLLDTLRRLRDLGNTVLVVEHDEDTMRAADRLVELGPGAGVHGGEVVAEGAPDDVANDPKSVTGAYLSGARRIETPVERRTGTGKALTLVGCRANNLRDVTVSIPVGTLTCVTGVSGSGKSSLIVDTLQPAAAKRLHGAQGDVGAHDRIDGLEEFDKIVAVDQSPIGRTPRSNPATYTGLFQPMRDLFAAMPESKVRGYKAGRFSFNVKGGRCEACQGDGLIRIEMHFLPDVYVKCEACQGARYNRETLDVKFKGASIAEVLKMTVEDAFRFFESVPAIHAKLQTLHDVGLDYVELGQAATTLSGGEAQRIKLAKELSRRATGRTLYILDEPTTGLHFADIEKLLEVLRRLVDAGNTVVVIEHNLDVIKTADYLIDMGPEGGSGGGRVIAEGTPEAVAANPASHTGRFLAEKFERERRRRPRGARRAG